MENSYMPAMPQTKDVWIYGAGDSRTAAIGLTKREMMAMHMMQGILTGQDTNEMVVGDDKCFAEFAVQCADALIAELERTK